MSFFFRALRKLYRTANFYRRMRQARRLGIEFAKPNYIYLNRFDASSVVIDVGCGDEPDFSRHMISRFGLRAYGVDPTRKHAASLREMENRTCGRFKHLSFAVTSRDEDITFYESQDNVSGSVLGSHQNVVADRVAEYQVASTTLSGLLAQIGRRTADLIKLDLEGAEYELLSGVSQEELRPFEQIFVEFHHHCVPAYTPDDTKAAVAGMREKGFQSFTLDEHNYLFWRESS